jgi:uncharacterized repeat protein (TIGR02543 family)
MKNAVGNMSSLKRKGIGTLLATLVLLVLGTLVGCTQPEMQPFEDIPVADGPFTLSGLDTGIYWVEVYGYPEDGITENSWADDTGKENRVLSIMVSVKANETEASVTLKTDEKTEFAETGWFLVVVRQGINKDVTLFSVIQFIGGSADLDWEDLESPPGQGPYIVTFYQNYAGALKEPYYVSAPVAHGGSVLEPTVPLRTGAYAFAGWYTDANGGTEYIFSDAVTKDIKLYARWVEARIVTFYLNYVGAPEAPYYVDPSVAHGGSVLEPAAPLRTGAYVFVGWYKEAACVNPWNFTTDTVTASLDLYAKWAESDLPIL